MKRNSRQTRKPIRRHARRATVLLMVVSLLALLFVVVTGFLSLSRTERGLVEQVQESDLTDAIVDNTNELMMSLMAQQLKDNKGRVMGGGSAANYSAEDIAGYRYSNYQASAEPVWDAAAVAAGNNNISGGTGAGWDELQYLRWPAVTSLERSANATPKAFAIYQLIPENGLDNDIIFAADDVMRYARTPVADADADGVPDTHMLLAARATEMANMMAGESVPLPDPNAYGPLSVILNQIPGEGGGNNAWHNTWERFRDQARYDVAVRVVSNGGMVSLDSPTLYDQGGSYYTPFNRGFTVDMFDAIRNGGDQAMATQYGNPIEQNTLFDELSANVSAIEASLRRRMLLPGKAERGGGDDGSAWVHRDPAVLAQLQGEIRGYNGFPSTFFPQFTTRPGVNDEPRSQRVNMQGTNAAGTNEIDDRRAWAQSISSDASVANSGGMTFGRVSYDRRHLITAASYSDELARKQTAGDPKITPTRRLDLDSTGKRGSTYRGELKYYLGEISKAFVEVDPLTGAPSEGSRYFSYDQQRGNVIVEELARRFYDMLASHTGTGDDWGNVTDDTDSSREGVSARQQAFMLAVNTIAFAAPRSTNGNAPGAIPVVSYNDRNVIGPVGWYDNPRGNGAGGGDLRYVGYSPQPFFTEAIAYRDNEDPNDPNDDPNDMNIAIAVEMFNPNDPYYAGQTDAFGDVDEFGLWMSQFAVAVNGANPNDPNSVIGRDYQPMTGSPMLFRNRFNGRSFMRFVINTDQNSHFDGLVTPGLSPEISLDIEDPDPNVPFMLTLWRKDWRIEVATGNPVAIWFPIDKFVIDDGPTGGAVPNSNAWKSARRDTSPNPELGAPDLMGDGTRDYARWNVITRTIQEAGGAGSPPTSTIGNANWLTGIGVSTMVDGLYDSGTGPVVPTTKFSPTTPLITMNAGPVDDGEAALWEQFNNLPMFPDASGWSADSRPRSFPTVGFMLFVPRVSHVYNMSTRKFFSMSDTLSKQWSNRGYTASAGYLLPTDYPADFGHMPVFDNTQTSVANSYLTDVGKLPWGLLVFDYFTTLDPRRDRNGDGQPDVDPLRVPGRININAASWPTLANAPMMGPVPADTTGQMAGLMIGYATIDTAPSPGFWDATLGTLAGVDYFGAPRLLAIDNSAGDSGMPYADGATGVGRYRLGNWLAQSACAYRDGVQLMGDNGNSPYGVFAYSHARNAVGAGLQYRAANTPLGARPLYGQIRGMATGGVPTQFGFVSVGELLNVKGLDSSWPANLRLDSNGDGYGDSELLAGDFVRSVSVAALLDTQYLTTRTNTFTVYSTVMDRQDQQRSVRSQVTADRSNSLPRLQYAYYYPGDGVTLGSDAFFTDADYSALPSAPLLFDVLDAAGNPGGTPDLIKETPQQQFNDGAMPTVISERRAGYYNVSSDY